MRSCARPGFLILLFAPLVSEPAPLVFDRAHIELPLFMRSLSKLDLTPLLSGLVKIGSAILASDDARLGFLLLLRSFACMGSLVFPFSFACSEVFPPVLDCQQLGPSLFLQSVS